MKLQAKMRTHTCLYVLHNSGRDAYNTRSLLLLFCYKPELDLAKG